MTEDNHAKTIVEGSLDVSYEPAGFWVSDDGKEREEFPAFAVILTTKCCKLNHQHISIEKEQAVALAEWLITYANGEYDE